MNYMMGHDSFVGSPFGFGGFGFETEIVLLFIAWAFVFVWALFWKGVALWHAGRNGQWGWFIALLLINTVGVLEIVYAFFFRKDRETAPLLPFLAKVRGGKKKGRKEVIEESAE